MYRKGHKVNFKRAGSYIDSPNSIKKEKSNNMSKKLKMIKVFNTQQLLH